MFKGRQRLWKPGMQKWKLTTIGMQDFVPVDLPTIRVIYGTFNRLCERIVVLFGLPPEAVSSLRHENKFMLQNGPNQLYVEIEDLGAPSLEELAKVVDTELDGDSEH